MSIDEYVTQAKRVRRMEELEILYKGLMNLQTLAQAGKFDEIRGMCPKPLLQRLDDLTRLSIAEMMREIASMQEGI